MNFQESLLTRLEKRLRFIYKNYYSEELKSKLLATISKYSKTQNNKEKWSEKDVVLITYGDSIRKEGEVPLQTLNRFLVENLVNQFSVIHILPFFPFSSDDGFSVINFRKVNPELGSWNDIKSLTENFGLMTDLVINHASSQSEWFQNFLQQKGKGSDFFITENPETDLSQVVRPRSSPLLTPYKTANGIKHVWTTFSADQIDLNFSNPALLIEMIDILLGYIAKGARIIRLDAIAFLWKKAGTSCLHLPETHEVVKLLREVAEYINPSIVILTETNVPNKENLSYFGNNDEAHMVYQFSLPPLLLHALHSGNSTWLNEWAKSLPNLNNETTFFNFTASHDGIGVRPLEGLLPENEILELVENMQKFGGFVNFRSNPDGSKNPYELNITYFDALKGTKNGVDNFQVERFLASQIVMMSFQGIPAFYIHSLTATPNYIEGVEQTKHNRTINRRKWNLEELEELLKNGTIQKRVFESLQKLISIRKKQTAFHPNATQEILNLGSQFIGLIRTSKSGNQKIVTVVNLTDKKQNFKLPIALNSFQLDLISGKKISDSTLMPYQCMWLTKH